MLLHGPPTNRPPSSARGARGSRPLPQPIRQTLMITIPFHLPILSTHFYEGKRRALTVAMGRSHRGGTSPQALRWSRSRPASLASRCPSRRSSRFSTSVAPSRVPSAGATVCSSASSISSPHTAQTTHTTHTTRQPTHTHKQGARTGESGACVEGCAIGPVEGRVEEELEEEVANAQPRRKGCRPVPARTRNSPARTYAQ